MVIRTGLLGVGTAENPILDNRALDAVSELLHAHLPNVAIMLTQVAGSQRHWLADILTRWCDEEELDLILTLGGTLPAAGPSGSEIAPDATRDILERDLPGLAEAMRVHASAETRLAFLERGVCGIRGRTLLLNLPSGAATAVLFLSGVMDLIPAALAHLQETGGGPLPEDELDFVDEFDSARDLDHAEVERGTSSDEDSAPAAKLSAAEFAAFRRQRRGDTD